MPGRFRAHRGANPVRTKVRTLLFPNNPAHVSVDAAFSPLTRTAKCEPQTLQTLFPGQTVAQCCAVAPRIGISPGRTRFVWACVHSPTVTIGGDHHHRHNHHGRWPAVTVVMVVMVVAYCLHRRKRRYVLRVIVTASAPVTDATGLLIYFSRVRTSWKVSGRPVTSVTHA